MAFSPAHFALSRPIFQALRDIVANFLRNARV